MSSLFLTLLKGGVWNYEIYPIALVLKNHGLFHVRYKSI